MTERVRKRSSKWDLQEDPNKFSSGSRQDNTSFGKESEFIHDNGSKHEWNSSKNTGARDLKWSGTRAAHRDGNVIGDFNEVSENMKMWDRNRSYSTSISPGLDDWRQRSHSRSPRHGWSKSHRSRSRSPPHGLRSRSRSPPHGLRSRSRSPSHGFRRDSEGCNNQIRGGSGVSLCTDFARGRCRRGSECRYLHQENTGYESRRHSGSLPEENWGSRHERGGSYGHPNNVEREYSRDELSHGYDSQRNNRSSNRCINFLKGNCHRGSSCRFSHEHSMVDGHGASERTHDRDTYSGQDHRREPFKNNSTLCKFFAAGNCRKGINCRFSHEGAAHDRPEGGSADDRWGRNLNDEKKSWGGPKWSDETTDSVHGSAEGRSQNYGSGRIANSALDNPGWNKKSTWNDNKAVDGRPEARSVDERWGHNLGSWGGPKWGDEASGSVNGSVGHIASSGWDDATYCKQSSGQTWNDQAADDRQEGRSVDERQGHKMGDENKSWGGPKHIDEAVDSAHLEAADSEVKKIPLWGKNDNGRHAGGNDEDKSLGGTKWSDVATELEVTKTPDWKNDNDVKNGIPILLPTERSLDDRPNYCLNVPSTTWGVPTWSDNPSDQNVHKSPPRISDNNSASMGIHLSTGHEEVLNFTNMPSAGVERDQYPSFINDENTRFGIQDIQSHSQVTILCHERTSTPEFSAQQHHPTVAMYPEGQKYPGSTVIMYPAVSNMNAQNQQILFSPAPRARSFDLNGPVEDVPSPKHQTLSHMGETIQEVGKVDPKLSPINSGGSVAQNIVTSEQVAQISHISASLAQIFGNSQQLPQLYATLNSTKPTGSVPSHPNSAGLGASIGGSYVQSNQDTWSQKQYDPVGSSIESSHISIAPPGVSEDAVNRNYTVDHEAQAPPESSVPPSVDDGPNGTDPAKFQSLENTPHSQSKDLKQLESVGNERAVDCGVKEQDIAHLGDTNADDRIDEDGKKNKETKGMRMFKFALVEFVKEILKPTWKEGQLSKEAHKTVVKKVVEKVTGSIQGDHVPQTQEKIDQYLAYSKSKLTKLVEAYVEKYLKS